MAEDVFSIDGKEYTVASLKETHLRIYQQLQFTRVQLKKLTDLRAVLNKAKNSYMGELKTEIVQKRSGIDLHSLFSED